MANGINWALAAQGQQNFMRHLDLGMQLGQQAAKARDERQMRKALGALQDDDPANDRDAMTHVFQRNPELGMRLRQDAERRELNAAMGDYLMPGGQPNALLGLPGPISGFGGGTLNGSQATPVQQPAPQMGQNALLSAIPAAQPGQSFQSAFAPFAPPPPTASTPPAPVAPDEAGDPTQPDGNPFSFLGRPRSQEDAAFLRMVRIDPFKALEIRSTLRDDFLKRAEAERDFYTASIDELSRMTDDAGWQRALQRLAPMAQALDVDLLSSVPVTYPGPAAVRELLENALPVKERLDYFLREANYEADNERADRNTDSLIEDREARRSEQRRYNDERLGLTRRGQDIASTDRRRGQDIGSRDRQRGQDNPRRGRSTGGGGSNLPLVRTPAEARKLPKGTRFRTPDGQVKVVP